MRTSVRPPSRASEAISSGGAGTAGLLARAAPSRWPAVVCGGRPVGESGSDSPCFSGFSIFEPRPEKMLDRPLNSTIMPAVRLNLTIRLLWPGVKRRLANKVGSASQPRVRPVRQPAIRAARCRATTVIRRDAAGVGPLWHGSGTPRDGDARRIGRVCVGRPVVRRSPSNFLECSPWRAE